MLPSTAVTVPMAPPLNDRMPPPGGRSVGAPSGRSPSGIVGMSVGAPSGRSPPKAGPPPKPPAQVPSSVGWVIWTLVASTGAEVSVSVSLVLVDTATTHDPTVTSASVPSTVAENVVASVQVTAVCESVDRSCMTVPVTDAISPDAPPPPPGPERCGPSPCRVADVESSVGVRRRRRRAEQPARTRTESGGERRVAVAWQGHGRAPC